MKKLTTLFAGASALLFSTSAFAVNALDFTIDASLDWAYDSDNGIDSWVTANSFESFAGTSPDLTGLAVLLYEISDFSVNGFDPNEVYQWCIEGAGFYEYGYTLGPNGPSGGNFDAGPFSASFEASLSDITNFLFGTDPSTVLSALISLPSSGTLDDLGIPGLDLLLPTAAINYDAAIGYPIGYVTLDTELIAPGVNTFGSAGVHLEVSAKRASVPDSGTTSLMTLAGLGILVLARRRLSA